MTRLSDLGPPIPGKRHGGELRSAGDYFYPCPVCGQKVDQRDARQVFYHEQPRHEPLELEPGATILQFSRRTDSLRVPRRSGRLN